VLYLVSSSPTRAKILDSFKVEFCQKPCGFDEESIAADTPREFVYKATAGKLEWAKREYGIETPILCADTVVTDGKEILRKPKDREDARAILLRQSGKSVGIITCTAYASKALTFLDLSVTEYFFAEFDWVKLEAHLDSMDWEGKAGGCMVEGFCKEYIVSQKGLDSCAMGLTIEKLLPFIR
jgi:septum formation protein